MTALEKRQGRRMMRLATEAIAELLEIKQNWQQDDPDHQDDADTIDNALELLKMMADLNKNTRAEMKAS